MDSGIERARKLLTRAQFALSVPEPHLLPADRGHEIAFAGRSNAGKSSALNMLCAQRGLARTSRTPGRTQHIVVFDLDTERRLVDLPGFGYAKVAKSMRAHWEQALPEYLETRACLCGLILLMDIRHPLKPQDVAVLEWCTHAGVPVHVLLNKSDKLGRGPATAALHLVNASMKTHGWLGTAQLFSALKHEGAELTWQVLGQWLELG